MKTPNVTEIADKIYRLSTFLPKVGPNGFTFNQFLVDAERPLLFHYGQRALFPLVSEAVKSVIALDKLAFTTCSHVEADEFGRTQRMAGRRAQRHAGTRPGRLQHLADRHGQPSAARR